MRQSARVAGTAAAAVTHLCCAHVSVCKGGGGGRNPKMGGGMQQDKANEEVKDSPTGHAATDQQDSVEQNGVAEQGSDEIDEKDKRISELESKLVDEENKLLRVLADF